MKKELFACLPACFSPAAPEAAGQMPIRISTHEKVGLSVFTTSRTSSRIIGITQIRRLKPAG